MRTFAQTLAIALVVGGIGTATAEEAAAGKYAVTTVVNRFNQTMNYHYRWGDGPWKTASLAPGIKNRHSWQYQFNGQNTSPNFQIRFDADLGPGVWMRTYNLKRYATQSKFQDGKRHTFEHTGIGRTIKLVYLN